MDVDPMKDLQGLQLQEITEQMRHAVDDDNMFSLSDGFKSATVKRVPQSTAGKQVFSPTRHNTR